MRNDAALFPIRGLVERTGVNASTLRAWENRHGLLRPARTESGHRLYSQVDVARVQRIQELLAQGLALNRVATRLEKEMGGNLDTATLAGYHGDGPGWPGYIAESLRALEDFSGERLDRIYGEACALYPIDVVTGELLIPVLEHLGVRWKTRESGIAEEHFYSAWLRNKLCARLHHASATPRGHSLVLACLPGETHEIGLLIFALNAIQAGYGVTYLGPDMPIRQIIHVASHVGVVGVVLSGRAAQLARAVLDDIAWLVALAEVPVFVGSRVSVSQIDRVEATGAIALGDHMGLGLNRIEAGIRSAARQPG